MVLVVKVVLTMLRIVLILSIILISGCGKLSDFRKEKRNGWIEDAQIDCDKRDGYLIIEYQKLVLSDEPAPWICVPKEMIRSNSNDSSN